MLGFRAVERKEDADRRGGAAVNNPKISIVVEAGEWPPKAALNALARKAIKAAVEVIGEKAASNPSPNPSPQGGGELSVVFTDDAEMRKLNKAWRGKDKPTNVLSFPQTPGPSARRGPPEGAQPLGARPPGPLLGDVILSAETVAREAALAQMPLEDHMAHLLIHGFLHLLGHAHEADGEAEKMEQLERLALKKLGISDPYATARGR